MIIRKIFLITLAVLFAASQAFASNAPGEYKIEKRRLHYKDTIRKDECPGHLDYPYLIGKDQDICKKINEEIHDFVELHGSCLKEPEGDAHLSYAVQATANKNIISIKWRLKEKGEIKKIDTLNIKVDECRALHAYDVLAILDKDKLNEMIELSDKHLSQSCGWGQFLDKVEKEEIQFYMKNKHWHIIFNITDEIQHLVDVPIPNNLLKKERDI